MPEKASQIQRSGRDRGRNLRHGRRSGGHNKGYWYRKGRGWYVTTEGNKAVPLRDENGDHLRDSELPDDRLREHYARWLIAEREQQGRKTNGDSTPLMEVCRLYLDHAERNNKPGTVKLRAAFLFDFAAGFPACFRTNGKTPTKQDRIHLGFGSIAASELIPYHIEQWLAAHPNWEDGTRRIAVKSVLRAMNYATKAGLLSRNPIRGGVPIPKSGKRVTYFTPDIEEAMYKHARKPLAEAIRVCLRTGVRYGCEFCALTSRHVEETEQGQIWRFSPTETKNGKERIVYVPQDIAKLVRDKMKRVPPGTSVFRNMMGRPWHARVLQGAFNRMKERMERDGFKFSPDDCMYSTRHTYAKRILGGYWTGKPTTIEVLAKMMGDSREICWEYYAQWCDRYTQPLWEALG